MEEIAQQLINQIKTSKFSEYISKVEYKELRGQNGNRKGKYIGIILETTGHLSYSEANVLVYKMINESTYQLPRAKNLKVTEVHVKCGRRSPYHPERVNVDTAKLIESIKVLTEVDLSIIPDENYFSISIGPIQGGFRIQASIYI